MVLRRSQIVFACLSLTALALLIGINPLSNNDIWLHLTTGRLILERGAIPTVDEYSFTVAGAPYVAHEWLAQVLFTLIFQTLGVTGLIALKPIALAVTATLVSRTCCLLGAGPVATFWAAALVLASLASHLYVRPHLFTFILLAATGWILARMKHSRDWRSLSGLALGQMAWANLHGGFLMGIARAGLAGAAMPALVMLLASLVNPRGWKSFLFPVVFADPAFREHIREWGGPFEEPFLGSFFFTIYGILLVLCLVSMAYFVRCRRYGPALTLLAFVILSAVSKRNVSVLAVVAAPWIAVAMTRIRRARLFAPGPVLAASSGVVLVLAAGITVFGVPHETGAWRRAGTGIGENIPVAALDYIESGGLGGNALASFGIASYVIFREYPESRVFIDSRLDVFGGDLIELYQAAMKDPIWMKALLARHRIDYAILSYIHDNVAGPVTVFDEDPDWALVYYDDVALVYVSRQPHLLDVFERDAYNSTNPYRFLSGRREGMENLELALAETDRALRLSPTSRVARVMRGTTLQAMGRHREAVATFEEALDLAPVNDDGSALLLGLLGTSYFELHEDIKAKRMFERLLEISPDSRYAGMMLEQLRMRHGKR